MQVVEALPSTQVVRPWPEGEAHTHRVDVCYGDVNFHLLRYTDGKPAKPWASPKIDQGEFVEFLRTGVLRDLVNLPAELAGPT